MIVHRYSLTMYVNIFIVVLNLVSPQLIVIHTYHSCFTGSRSLCAITVGVANLGNGCLNLILVHDDQ